MKEDTILPIHSPTLSNTTAYPPMPTIPTKGAPPPKARGIARLTVHIPSAFRKDVGKTGPGEVKSSPPRWNTLEFRIYYLCAVVALYFAVWIPVSLSQRGHPSLSCMVSLISLRNIPASHRNFHLYSPRLKPGWLHGRYVVCGFQMRILNVYHITTPLGQFRLSNPRVSQQFQYIMQGCSRICLNQIFHTEAFAQPTPPSQCRPVNRNARGTSRNRGGESVSDNGIELCHRKILQRIPLDATPHLGLQWGCPFRKCPVPWIPLRRRFSVIGLPRGCCFSNSQ